MDGKAYFIIPLSKEELMFPNIDLDKNHEVRLAILCFKE